MKATMIAFTALAITLAAGTRVHGQDTSASYEGVVTGSSVYVRSGPSMGSYPVTKLNTPARVQVTKTVSDEWLAVKPVAGCFGVVNGQYVQPDAAGKIGTITGDSVHIRAAGNLRTKDFTVPLGKLNRGDRVRIIGRVIGADREIAWYIIKPPANVRFYISSRFVRRADGTTPPPPVTGADKTATTLTPLASKTPPSKTTGTAPVRKELDALRQIRALEKDLVAESAKPVGQRNFGSLLARAKKIELPKGSRFQPIYDSLLQYIGEEVSLVKEIRAADRMVDEVLKSAAAKRAGTPIPTKSKPGQPTRDAKPFDIEGVMTASALYTLAQPDQPKRYVVRSVKTRAITGYVQSSGGRVNLEDYKGRNVGIHGRETFDKKVAMKIVEVDSITLLDEQPAKKKPVSPTPIEPKPVKPAPVEPEPEKVEPEPIPAKPEPEKVEPEPIPAKPEPEKVEPEPIPAKPEPAKAEPEPIPAKPEPEKVEPEPIPAKPEPEPAKAEPEPIPAKPEPEKVEPEPIPAKPEPKPLVPEKPKPVEKKPAANIPAEKEPDVLPPAMVQPAKAQPMEIKPIDVKPTEIDSPILEEPTHPKPSTVKADPAKPEQPAPVKATDTPQPEPKMFEVQKTQGDVEVEWD